MEILKANNPAIHENMTLIAVPNSKLPGFVGQGDNSGPGNAVEGVDYVDQWYNYPLVFALAAGAPASVQNTMSIDSSSEFIVTQTQLTYIVTGAIAPQQSAQVIPDYLLCTLMDGGSDKQINNIATPIVSLFGTGQLPFILPKPRTLAPSSTLQVNVTSALNVPAAATLYLTFSGVKRYWYKNDKR